MAQTNNVAWHITPAGDETNGGGFDPSLTANMFTDGQATSATGNSPVFHSASYSFVAGDINAAIYIAFGTDWLAGWYPIVSVSGGNATLGAAISTLRDNAISVMGDNPIVAGCATTASPTGATWSIDYSWLDTAPWSASNGTSTASTTWSSSTSGGGPAFHKAMIGNTVRTSGGSGATTGYNSIVNVTNGTTLVLDAASGTTTAGVFKIGGAHLHILSYSNGGGGAAPILPTPLLAGHKIFIKGGGTNSPSSADYVWGNYWTFPAGDLVNGTISMFGYYGRPRIDVIGLLGFGANVWLVVNFLFYCTSAAFSTYGIIGNAGTTAVNARNVWFDQAGNDLMLWTTFRSSVTSCLFFDSANSSAGSNPAINTGHVGASISGCVFYGVKGPAVGLHGRCAIVEDCVIVNGKSDGLYLTGLDVYMDEIVNCTIDNNAGNGLQVDTGAMGMFKMVNTIISNHTGSGKKGINCVDALDVNLRLVRHMIDFNTWYGNTTNFNGWQLNTHDDTLDPQYTNTGSKDYSVGANMKATGYPSSLPFG